MSFSTFNNPVFNRVPFNAPGAPFIPVLHPNRICLSASMATYRIALAAAMTYRIALTASMANYRIALTAKAGCMVPKTIHLKDYAIGDNQPIDFTLTSWPSGQTLAKAYLTIKKNRDGASDTDALIQKEITTSAGTPGAITNNGATGGSAIGYFNLLPADYANLVAGVAYEYDIQVINSSGALYTPIDGTITFKKDVTKKTS